jgi:GST-like protein
MLEIYAFATPNSLKPVIALEELGLEYKLSPVDLRKGEQRGESFRVMNPNGKVPVMVDREITLSESAAILLYLAEAEGKLLPSDPASRARAYEQLFFHASGVSPAYLQAFLIGMQKDPPAEAKERAFKEVDRVLGVIDQILAHRTFMAGEEYSIADIAHFGWLWRSQAVGVNFDIFPNVGRWYQDVNRRPSVFSAIAKVTALAA